MGYSRKDLTASKVRGNMEGREQLQEQLQDLLGLPDQKDFYSMQSKIESLENEVAELKNEIDSIKDDLM